MHRPTAVLALVLASVLTACGDGGTPTAPGAAVPMVARASSTSNPTATFTFSAPIAGSLGGAYSGDGRAANGSPSTDGTSTYAGGQCGVTSAINVTSGTGDATMQPQGNSTQARQCPGGPRTITLSFGQPIAGTAVSGTGSVTFVNLRNVTGVSSTTSRSMGNNVSGVSSCGTLKYGIEVNGSYQPLTTTINGTTVTSYPLQVSQVSANTWSAASVADPSTGEHVAICQTTVQNKIVYTGAYDLPLSFTVVQN